MKNLTFTRQSQPEDPRCYNDHLTVFDNDSGEVLFESPCRTWPNPYRPSDHYPCEKAYGAIAPGSFNGVYFSAYSNREPFLRCIEIADGTEIPCMWPNVNHDNRPVVAGVFVHHGQSDAWSGSAACLTLPLECWDDFCALFTDKEEVVITLNVSNGVAS